VKDRLRTVAAKIDRIDRGLVHRSAIVPHWPADPAFKGLTTAANHSALWAAFGLN
jgi:hypothetical protein